MINYYSANFQGNILKRGFWIYIWHIKTKNNKKYYYIGRTGDSSSKYASSPFSRLGQHLDMRKNAKGNSMYRNLKKIGINPCECEFNMFACGPIFLEQSTIESHRIRRDKMAAIENKLYCDLKKEGCEVIGNVNSKKEMPPKLLRKYKNIFDSARCWISRLK